MLARSQIFFVVCLSAVTKARGKAEMHYCTVISSPKSCLPTVYVVYAVNSDLWS